MCCAPQENTMQWPTVADIRSQAPLPPGYHYELLDRRQIPHLISSLEAWYPGIAVGNASCHLREKLLPATSVSGG
jgi:hypothetical protein